MANSTGFVAHVLELMREAAFDAALPVACASARAMFGGHGIYADATIVAIVIDDVLYLKADESSRAEFTALGLEPFSYVTRAGTRSVMSYYRAPDEALESPAAMARWLRTALGAALRGASGKPRRVPRGSPGAKQAGKRSTPRRR